MLQEPYITFLLKKSQEFSLGAATELAKRGVDAIWFGDDYGTQDSLKMWKYLLMPLKKMAIIKSYLVRLANIIR